MFLALEHPQCIFDVPQSQVCLVEPELYLPDGFAVQIWQLRAHPSQIFEVAPDVVTFRRVGNTHLMRSIVILSIKSPPETEMRMFIVLHLRPRDVEATAQSAAIPN